MYHANGFTYNIKETLAFFKKIGYYIRQKLQKNQKKCFFCKNYVIINLE